VAAAVVVVAAAEAAVDSAAVVASAAAEAVVLVVAAVSLFAAGAAGAGVAASATASASMEPAATGATAGAGRFARIIDRLARSGTTKNRRVGQSARLFLFLGLYGCFAALATATLDRDLGQDRHRDFFRRNRAEIEAGRRLDAIKRGCIDAFRR
jgi:hypothetical protein